MAILGVCCICVVFVGVCVALVCFFIVVSVFLSLYLFLCVAWSRLRRRRSRRPHDMQSRVEILWVSLGNSLGNCWEGCSFVVNMFQGAYL